jgi:predicted amidophosphoribosyltransferase
MGFRAATVAVLVPPLCAACRRHCGLEAVLCDRCARRLDRSQPLPGAGPSGIDRAWSAASYEGIARELVVALKFRRLLPVAELMAIRIEALAPPHLLSGAVVPVPAAPSRRRRRGFDPAAELAAALADRLAAPLALCLARRSDRRQVGRGRAARLGSPPRVSAIASVPRSVLLVDDVLTTRNPLRLRASVAGGRSRPRGCRDVRAPALTRDEARLAGRASGRRGAACGCACAAARGVS